MIMNINAEINIENTLEEIKDRQGITWLFNELGIDEDSILDEFYFSEILDRAISRDQAEVESDIASSNLDMVPADTVYNPRDMEDVKRFLSETLASRVTGEAVFLAIKNVAAEIGWELVFTKKI